MHFAEGGEPLAVMTPEVTKDGDVDVEPQELAYDLDGENLCIRKFGLGPRALSSIRSPRRQKTATIKVSRSTGSDLLRFDWFGHHRAWGGLLCYSTVQRNMHLGLARR
jgi:hypothetical protein